MTTRFRRPIQAAALLFSLSLFIGYLWSTQRQSGLPSIGTITEESPAKPGNPFDDSYTITLDPPALAEFEAFVNYSGTSSPVLMPGSKNISQPVFSTRKVQPSASPPAPTPAPAPIMPSSKLGIFTLPNLSFDPSTQHGSMMSSSKSGRVFSTLPTPPGDSPAHSDTIKIGRPTEQIHRIDPAKPVPTAPMPSPSGIPTP
jgi:hypothetical protein